MQRRIYFRKNNYFYKKYKAMITQEESYLLFSALVSILLLGVFFYKLFEIAKTLKEINRKLPDINPEPEHEKAPE